ncbi:hypothetical protein FOCC_FOCC000329 [Frankliniella occidentalis]|nr:hypothetical protein FOCC_FOCC000329 [Frankliniella occidentalis]
MGVVEGVRRAPPPGGGRGGRWSPHRHAHRGGRRLAAVRPAPRQAVPVRLARVRPLGVPEPAAGVGGFRVPPRQLHAPGGAALALARPAGGLAARHAPPPHAPRDAPASGLGLRGHHHRRGQVGVGVRQPRRAPVHQPPAGATEPGAEVPGRVRARLRGPAPERGELHGQLLGGLQPGHGAPLGLAAAAPAARVPAARHLRVQPGRVLRQHAVRLEQCAGRGRRGRLAGRRQPRRAAAAGGAADALAAVQRAQQAAAAGLRGGPGPALRQGQLQQEAQEPHAPRRGGHHRHQQVAQPVPRQDGRRAGRGRAGRQRGRHRVQRAHRPVSGG